MLHCWSSWIRLMVNWHISTLPASGIWQKISLKFPFEMYSLLFLNRIILFGVNRRKIHWYWHRAFVLGFQACSSDVSKLKPCQDLVQRLCVGSVHGCIVNDTERPTHCRVKTSRIGLWVGRHDCLLQFSNSYKPRKQKLTRRSSIRQAKGDCSQ